MEYIKVIDAAKQKTHKKDEKNSLIAKSVFKFCCPKAGIKFFKNCWDSIYCQFGFEVFSRKVSKQAQLYH